MAQRKSQRRETDLLFSVIYSFDCDGDRSVSSLEPPNRRRLWEITERGESEYGVFTKGKHRKYCALLTKDEFRDFISHCDLVADSTETMGSIGAPGFGFGWAPAVSFNSEWSGDCFGYAYVTPVYEPRMKSETDYAENGRRNFERDFRRLRAALLSQFGNYYARQDGATWFEIAMNDSEMPEICHAREIATQQ